MANKLNPFQGIFQNKRAKLKRAIIHNPGGENLELSREEILVKTETGDFESVETINSVILSSGEKVTSHLEVVGKCFDCGGYVTQKSVRDCLCGKKLCAFCSEFWPPEGCFLCSECHGKEKRKSFWASVFATILGPFIRSHDV